MQNDQNTKPLSAYWRRGHASRLVSWSTTLADLDGVPMVRLLFAASVAARVPDVEPNREYLPFPKEL